MLSKHFGLGYVEQAFAIARRIIKFPISSCNAFPFLKAPLPYVGSRSIVILYAQYFSSRRVFSHDLPYDALELPRKLLNFMNVIQMDLFSSIKKLFYYIDRNKRSNYE